MLAYSLHLETDRTTNVVTLRLFDEHGSLRGNHQVVLRDHGDSKWEAIFDTRHYVERYQHALRDEHGRLKGTDDLLDELGVFIGQAILGPEILGELTRTIQYRTLVVRLPSTEDDVLASAFARVPWELARPATGQSWLLDRNLAVRAVTETTEAGDSVVHRVAEHLAATKGVVRVLAVFAAAPGSRPLAMRLERERLRQLFEQEILPHRNVELDVLCHGVTRGVLRERITARGGFHIVHWVGHGHHDHLELLGEDDEPASLSGHDLVKLLSEAGGFVPQLVFLSACLSGLLVGSESHSELRRALRGPDHGHTRSAPHPRLLREVLDPDNAPGHTGTAMALLHAGVPQVVAMRYEVGDDYARELAWWFYKRLLADPGKPPTETALALARSDVRQRGSIAANHMPVDHANPLLFGQPGRRLEPGERRSKQMQRLRPRPQPLLPRDGGQLDRPECFAGREPALTQINRAWQRGGPAVTVLHGMRGLGKTALAAEALHLWHERFDWVLAFRITPSRLSLDNFLQQVDQRLTTTSAAYRERCEESPLERVWLEPSGSLRGQDRYDRMQTNLVEAMRDEAVLLVLDGFEPNLECVPSEGGYGCADPQWDALLAIMTEELPRTRSRVLVTTLHRPKALVSEGTLWLPLGQWSWEEMVLYVRSHDGLSKLLDDDAGENLLERIWSLAGGHPLLWDRLATLTADRKALSTVLAQLEREGLKALPKHAEMWAKERAETERAYLTDVALGSVDFLLERISAPARTLLWVLALSNGPVSHELLANVWSKRSIMDEAARLFQAMLTLPDERALAAREYLAAMPAELFEHYQAHEPGQAEDAPIEPLLDELLRAGLVNRQEPSTSQGAIASALFGCQHLVRRRVATWMEEHPDDTGGRTPEQVWSSYGERYAAEYEDLFLSCSENGRGVAVESGLRALAYLVHARDFERLAWFAGMLTTGTSDPAALAALTAELQAVIDDIPEGWAGWSIRMYLADTLRRLGRPHEALPFYEQAATEAEQDEDWRSVAAICGNWAIALVAVGQLDASKAIHLRSAEAARRADLPRGSIILGNLEALRIDVLQGHAERVLPDIEALVEEVRRSWRIPNQSFKNDAHQEFWDRALVTGLDVLETANRALGRWQACIACIKAMEEVERTLGESELALTRTRFNQYAALLQLDQVDAAKRLVEACLAVFREAGDEEAESLALSALARIWAVRGEIQVATELQRHALELCNRLPNPGPRAICHDQLGNCLRASKRTSDAATHHIAALAYWIVAGLHEPMMAALRGLAKHRQCTAAKPPYRLPRLASILVLPEFRELHGFLTDHGVDFDELQDVIDHLDAQIDEAARA